ncbi:MAG: hypothetical protein RSE00_05515 [Clostridia bacterium]
MSLCKKTSTDVQRKIIFDLDGTFSSSFKCIDNIIISRWLFEKERASVKVLDRILWHFNNLDIFPNTTRMLVLRLKLYTFLNGQTNYKEVMARYKKQYVMLTQICCDKNLEIIETLKNDYNYDIIVLSNNAFALDIKIPNVEIYSVRSKRKFLSVISEMFQIDFFVGNNFLDDIMSARHAGVKSIYMGKSKLVYIFLKGMRKSYTANDLYEVLEIIKKV